MFKSLIQPLQLFLKGATGKDRHQNQKLIQRISQLQIAYDDLLTNHTALEQSHSSLQEQHRQIKSQHAKLRSRCNRLREQHQETTEMLDYTEGEVDRLVAEKGKLRSHLKRLGAEKTELAGEVVVLKHKLGLREYSDEHSSEGGAETTLDFMSDRAIDLSDISLALVGGHETTHREVRDELRKYGLKRCIHVPPHSRESNSRHQIRDKIGNCDLVVTITSYIDHSVTKCVKQLQANDGLAGEVILVHSHGKSSVVREVLDYFAG